MLRSLTRASVPAHTLGKWPARLTLMIVATNPFAAERDRWFLWLTPLFGVGIAIYFGLHSEPGWAVVALLALPPPALMLALGVNTTARPIIVATMALIAGFTAAKLRTESVRAPVLGHTLKSVEVRGYIERNEVRSDGSSRLTLHVIAIAGLADRETPARVRIRLRKGGSHLAPGDTIRIKARLAPPPPPAIPRGYDFARAAYFQGIGAVGFALAPPKKISRARTPPCPVAINARLQRLRRLIGARIEAALPGETGVMANALMTGERSGISRETNELYRNAGIFHILSISGLHMAIMGGSVFVALRFILALFPTIALRYPVKKWAAAAAACATLAYLLVSGAAHPTVRSFIMIAIMFMAILLDRPAIALRNVAIAALLILAVMPESLFNAGFQLSFAAVTCLIATYETYQARKARRRQTGLATPPPTGVLRWLQTVWFLAAGIVSTTIVAGLATAPLAAFHFHTSQQYSVLTNMLAIPVSNLLVMPAALAAFIAMPAGLEAWPLAVMGYGIEIMTWSARMVAALPGAVVVVPAFPASALQLMIFGALWLCIWRRPWRWLGALVITAGFATATLGHHPAALIGKNGELLALRDKSNRLAAIKARGAAYEYGRWLEHDGDTRKPETAWDRKPFRCDLEGCTGLVGRHRISMVRSPAALVDDCRRAHVIILSFPQPAGCRTTATVLDYRALRRNGTHALYLAKDGSIEIETVEQFRGDRPWTMTARTRSRAKQWHTKPQTDNGHTNYKHSNYARRRSRSAKLHPTPSPRHERPEIEDGHPLYWYR